MHAVTAQVVLAAVTVDPSGTGAPGAAQVQRVVNAIAFYGLLACVVGLVIAAASWAFASRTGAVNQEAASKKAAAMALAGAVVIGAAAGLINWSQALGGGVK